MEKAVVYGIGRDFFKYESEIRSKYDIVCLMDGDSSRGEGQLHGIPLLGFDQLKNTKYDVIVVVPSFHKMEIVRDLQSAGVPEEKIIPYVPIASTVIPNIKLRVEGDICCGVCGRLRFKLKHSSDFAVLNQVFAHTEYGLITNISNISVIDVGMNVGLTSLFFANMDNVNRVYGYEPFPETYLQAIHNFSINSAVIRDKIKPCQAGWSNREGLFGVAEYNNDFSWGMRVGGLEPVLDDATDDAVRLFRADIELSKILAERKDDFIVLKLDCEGSEYDILPILDEAGLLPRIDIILMETHDFREEEALKIIQHNGFVAFHQFNGTSEGLGMVYAVKMRA